MTKIYNILSFGSYKGFGTYLSNSKPQDSIFRLSCCSDFMRTEVILLCNDKSVAYIRGEIVLHSINRIGEQYTSIKSSSFSDS